LPKAFPAHADTLNIDDLIVQRIKGKSDERFGSAAPVPERE
jgi:hypothetical protein